MIHFVAGDLFVNRHKAVALAHGCNCQGFWGAGIALQFKKNFPKAFDEYRLSCQSWKEELAGTCSHYDDRKNSGYYVLNLYTQVFPGPCAKYEYIEASLVDCKTVLDKENIDSLAMPAIGAGIGGLKLEKVKDIVRLVFTNWSGNVYFYEKYEAGL
jgi:O-acetyl-ADP-ribose deacetylase (regulator of RNase III)